MARFSVVEIEMYEQSIKKQEEQKKPLNVRRENARWTKRSLTASQPAILLPQSQTLYLIVPAALKTKRKRVLNSPSG
jgi:hypothetical protein